jgi:hypothetical protein
MKFSNAGSGGERPGPRPWSSKAHSRAAICDHPRHDQSGYRPVFQALQNTNALFADTKFDASVEVSGAASPHCADKPASPSWRMGSAPATAKLWSPTGYWLGAHSLPGNSFPPLDATLSLKNTGITHPVLVDVVSGEIKPDVWKQGTTDTLEALPIKDSIMLVTDEHYFDWPVLGAQFTHGKGGEHHLETELADPRRESFRHRRGRANPGRQRKTRKLGADRNTWGQHDGVQRLRR